METALAIVAALLSLYPHQRFGNCIRRRQHEIAARAEGSATRHGVPVAILLSVGYLESSWGCHPRSGGCWGAPVDVRHRGTAGTADHAAAALARSYRVCGTWLGGVSRFRCGLCRCPRLVGYEPGDAMALADALNARTSTR